MASDRLPYIPHPGLPHAPPFSTTLGGPRPGDVRPKVLKKSSYLLKLLFLFLILCVCQWNPKEAVGSFGAGVTVSCKPPAVDAEN